MLGAVHRAAPRLVHGVGERLFPGVVFHGEDGPFLRRAHGGVTAEGGAHQAALQAQPAARGFRPVAGHVRPEIHARAGQAALPGHVAGQARGADGHAAVVRDLADDGRKGQEFLDEVEGDAVLLAGAECVAQADGVGQRIVGRGLEDEQPGHPVHAALLRVQRVVQAFPVARAQAALCGGLHVDVGEIGGDGGGARVRGQGGLARGLGRGGQQALFAQQPRAQAGHGLHRRGQAVVQRGQALLGREGSGVGGGCGARSGSHSGRTQLEPAAGGGAEAQQDARQHRVVGDRADMVGAGVLDGQLQRAQFGHFVQVAADFRMLFGKRGEPPVREGVAHGQQFTKVSGGADGPGQTGLVRPGDVLAPDVREVLLHQRGHRKMPVRHVAPGPVGHHRGQAVGFRLRAGRGVRSIQQDEGGHAGSLATPSSHALSPVRSCPHGCGVAAKASPRP